MTWTRMTSVLHGASLIVIATALVLMWAQPDLRHEYVIGPVSMTRHVLTQGLLGTFIVLGVAELAAGVISGRRKASGR